VGVHGMISLSAVDKFSSMTNTAGASHIDERVSTSLAGLAQRHRH
jgi:hypothetical protein